MVTKRSGMSLSTKMVYILAGVFTLLLAVSAILYLLIVNSTFDEIENKQDQAELDRVAAVLTMQMEDIEYLADDFGHWDLTYDYVESRDTKYEQANLGEGELAFLGAHFVAIVNSAEEIIFSRNALAPDSNPVLPENFVALWQRAASPRSGFIASEHGPVMVSIQDIRHSNSSGL